MELTSCYRSAPGCCTVCASSGPGPVVDLCVPDVAMFHRTMATYLCADCARQVAVLILGALGETIVATNFVVTSVARSEALVAERDAAAVRADKAEGLLRQLREGAFS